VNLVISVAFHALIMGALLYFAAREGVFGKKISKIAIEMVKEKPKEPEKPKPVEKKATADAPKENVPKVVQTAKLETPKETAPPPSSAAPPSVAPPAAELPAFEFDGGRTVVSSADPVQLYRDLLRNSLQYNWERPKDIDDHTNVAEVEVAVNKAGEITNPVWKKTSGQKKWDDSVRLAIASTKKVGRPPPTNFPTRVVVRFDVEALAPVAQ
jgi:hypothetical protein